MSLSHNTPDASFLDRLKNQAAQIDAFLNQVLMQNNLPARLREAMTHAVLAGGKRVRPFLTIEVARILGVTGTGCLRAGCAIELLHTYSLVHDDLPSMDDDDLRRGQPTVHRAFDEATAILAGDALQALAFEVLAHEDTHPDATRRARLVLGLAKASGMNGMVGGQMLDLAAEGRFGPVTHSQTSIMQMQAMKTGALLAFSVEAGCLLANADMQVQKAFQVYGQALGAVFQIADDILDRESSSEHLGKKTGKDQDKGKATLVDLLGLDGAKNHCTYLIDGALNTIRPLGLKSHDLEQMLLFCLNRSS